jgi:hypothetical protein
MNVGAWCQRIPELSMRLPLAVLIDAENISYSLFETLRTKVVAVGEPIVWQLHGELLAGWKPAWLEIAQKHQLEVRHHFHAGKNSSDIAIAVAAMDLLHAGVVRGFCIVSGDADFAPLVQRLRQQNMPVYGFGLQNAAEALRKSCTAFYELAEPSAAKPKVSKPSLAKSSVEHVAKEHGSASPQAVQADIARLRDLLYSICREHGSDGRIPSQLAGMLLRKQARGLVEKVVGKKDLARRLAQQGIALAETVDGQKMLRVDFKRPAVVSH